MPGQIHSLDLSRDDRFALVGLNNGQVLYFDLETGETVRTFRGHRATVGWVAFGPDGVHAFSAGADGTARQWNLDSGQQVAQFHVAGKRARGGVVSPDRRRLITGDGDGVVQVWDLATRQEVKRF